MIPVRTTPALFIVIVCVLMAAGCVLPFDKEDLVTNTSPLTSQSIAKYKVTIAQPEGWSTFIKMDSDLYNRGEVAEFYLKNEGTGALECSGDPPSYHVMYQLGNGTWTTRPGPEEAGSHRTTYLEPGESTAVSRFVTTDWKPTRYRIVSDCGISHDILIREKPTLVPVPCLSGVNDTLWIQVDPVADHRAGEKFSISGRTNIPAGEELRYSLFSLSPDAKNGTIVQELSSATRVKEGGCANNTWSVDLEIQTPKEYFIGISDVLKKVTAIKRFTIFPANIPTPAASPQTNVTVKN